MPNINKLRLCNAACVGKRSGTAIGKVIVHAYRSGIPDLVKSPMFIKSAAKFATPQIARAGEELSSFTWRQEEGQPESEFIDKHAKARSLLARVGVSDLFGSRQIEVGSPPVQAVKGPVPAGGLALEDKRRKWRVW